MRTLTSYLVVSLGVMTAAPFARAQSPPSGGADDLVTRMFRFDKDKDGTLSKAEITDDRLLGLFDRADADKNGSVSKAELTALAAKERPGDRGGPPGGGGRGGPGGPMLGGPPRPGEVLNPMLQDRLNLTAAQKSQLADLQKDVDAKLAAILTEDQKAQLKQMTQRGPGGFGRPGGGGPRGNRPPPPPPGDDRE